MILSILIVTLQGREKLFRELMDNLESQLMKFPPETIEILVKCDNGEETTGAKRDYLLRRAMGDYVTFADDDDWVPEYYISEIINAVKTNPDCVPIDGYMTTDGHNKIEWKMSKDHPNDMIHINGVPTFRRAVNHIGVVKTDIAKLAGFPPIRNGEDKAYSERIAPHLKTEVKINKPMYHYRYLTVPKLYK